MVLHDFSHDDVQGRLKERVTKVDGENGWPPDWFRTDLLGERRELAAALLQFGGRLPDQLEAQLLEVENALNDTLRSLDHLALFRDADAPDWEIAMEYGTTLETEQSLFVAICSNL